MKTKNINTKIALFQYRDGDNYKFAVRCEVPMDTKFEDEEEVTLAEIGKDEGWLAMNAGIVFGESDHDTLEFIRFVDHNGKDVE